MRVPGPLVAIPAAAGVLAVALAVPACSRRKLDECVRLTTVINASAVRIGAPADAASPESREAALRGMARALDDLAEEIGKVPLSTPELVVYSRQYQTIARDLARTFRAMHEAAERRDDAALGAAGAELDRTVAGELPIVEGLNRYCQSL